MKQERLNRAGFALNPDCMQQSVADETVILNPATGEMCILDDFSSAVWEIMQDYHSFPEILSLLEEAFDVDREQISRDLDRFGQRLVDLEIIWIV